MDVAIIKRRRILIQNSESLIIFDFSQQQLATSQFGQCQSIRKVLIDMIGMGGFSICEVIGHRPKGGFVSLI
jgi:hypothetical protein